MNHHNYLSSVVVLLKAERYRYSQVFDFTTVTVINVVTGYIQYGHCLDQTMCPITDDPWIGMSLKKNTVRLPVNEQ